MKDKCEGEQGEYKSERGECEDEQGKCRGEREREFWFKSGRA
jgi:hypothetical protein